MNKGQLAHILRSMLVTCCLLLISGFAFANILYVVNSQSRTISRIDPSTDSVNNSFASLGNVPNKIVLSEDYIWSVNSGDNAVQKISRATGATISNIHVGNGTNPWDAILHEEYLYVTGLFSGKVYKIDTLSGSVVGNVIVGTAPEALHVIGNKLYVTNAGNYAQNYAGSSVSVIDLASFSVQTTIPVSSNPQYLASHNGLLHVSCTGNWVDVGGAICIIDPATDTLIQTINLGGTPGKIWIASPSLALVADSNGAYLYSYHPETHAIIHGVQNPIPNGGSEIVGNSSFIAVLAPNWSGNGTLKLLHPDLSAWKQFTVALMPTDLKMYQDPTSAFDTLLPSPSLSVFPNPVRRGQKLEFSSSEALLGELCVYNTRGQKVASHHFDGQKSASQLVDLPSGVYFYRVSGPNPKSASMSGRFVVLR